MIPLQDRLRFLREEKGLSQLQLADALSIKPGTYSSYENGTIPKTETLVQLAKYHCVSLDYLVCLSNERRPVSGNLPAAFSSLAQCAGDAALTTSDVLSVLVAANKYYANGAPCGNVPLLALRGFMGGLRAAMEAASKDDYSAVVDAANAATIAALEIPKMPAVFLEHERSKNDD